jgi:predicted enzyme related to lactoylglutathione lyase
MQAIPWSTFALGSLLFIAAYPQGGQSVSSTQPAKSTPPVATAQPGRIVGIGGFFFKSANRDQTREWYSRHLGLDDKGQGAMIPWRQHDDPKKAHVTAWTVFPSSTKYFEPGHADFMIDYVVDDLDALLDRLKKDGVNIDPKRMNESFGKFAWIYDSDGNKIELWQPVSDDKEESKPAAAAPRGRVVGIGGIFFKSANRDQAREWYARHLGLDDKGQGAMISWRDHDDPAKERVTAWTVFASSTKYFDPGHASFMLDYMVDDLDALLERLKKDGVNIDPKRMDESFGKFAWIYDGDGNKIELWEPKP